MGDKTHDLPCPMIFQMEDEPKQIQTGQRVPAAHANNRLPYNHRLTPIPSESSLNILQHGIFVPTNLGRISESRKKIQDMDKLAESLASAHIDRQPPPADNLGSRSLSELRLSQLWRDCDPRSL